MGNGTFINLQPAWAEFISMLRQCVDWWANNGIAIFGKRYNYFEIFLAIVWAWKVIEIVFPWFDVDEDNEEDQGGLVMPADWDDANGSFWGV